MGNRFKLISTFLAGILLVSFVVAVGLVISSWFVNYVSKTSSSIELSKESKGECIRGFEIVSARRFGSKGFNITLINRDNVKLEGLDGIVVGFDGSVEKIRLFNGTVSPSTAVKISEYLENFPSAIKKVMIYSPSCMNMKEYVEFDGKSGDCPSGMVFVPKLGGFCIFKYEAAHLDATKTSPGTSNIPVSKKGVVPWANVSYYEAETVCKRAGYHLCTNNEWQAATGVDETHPDRCPHGNNNYGSYGKSLEKCNVTKGGACLTGTGPITWCSIYGVCDLNGNLAEWVSPLLYTSEPGNTSTVICMYAGNESYVDKENQLCLRGVDVRYGVNDGYVRSWDFSLNYPTLKLASGSSTYGDDYAWTPDDYTVGGYCQLYTVNETEKYRRGLLRGGWYTSNTMSGCYFFHAQYLPSCKDDGFWTIGFRCCL